MSRLLNLRLVLALGITGTALVCPLCGGGVETADAQSLPVVAQAPDTATVRLHISGMVCGSCPTTARLAMERVSGVYKATVTLDDSVGVVRYNPRRVTPAEITAQLTRVTDFRARILPDSSQGGAGRKPGES